LDDRFFGERRRRTRFDARAARDAFRLQERLVLAGGDFRIEAAAFDRERERALDLIARAHAARADDAQVRIEREVGIAEVLRLRALIRAATDRVARRGHADLVGDILQLAMAVAWARFAIERVIRDVELEHVRAQLRELFALRAYLH